MSRQADDLSATRAIFAPAFYIDDAVERVTMDPGELLAKLGDTRSGIVYVIPSPEWLDRFDVIRAALAGLGAELATMPRYERVSVSRMKLAGETVLDLEHRSVR